MVIIKKFLVIAIVLLVSPSLVHANKITLEQNGGWITYWDENKYYTAKNNMQVISHLKLSLSREFYKYSDNYTFEFSPSEPGYADNATSFEVQIFRDCNRVNIKYFLDHIINCNKGEELKEGKDFEVIEVLQDYPKRKAYNIRIFQNQSVKQWTNYDIFIRYQLKNFSKPKGTIPYFPSSYYFSLSKDCYDKCFNCIHDEQCPMDNSVSETIVMVDPNLKLIDPPYKKYFILDGIEYLRIGGLRTEPVNIEFQNVKETDFLIPLFWAFFGAVIGAIVGESLKNIWKFGYNTFKTRFLKNSDKKRNHTAM